MLWLVEPKEEKYTPCHLRIILPARRSKVSLYRGLGGVFVLIWIGFTILEFHSRSGVRGSPQTQREIQLITSIRHSNHSFCVAKSRVLSKYLLHGPIYYFIYSNLSWHPWNRSQGPGWHNSFKSRKDEESYEITWLFWVIEIVHAPLGII